jgi:hypothetical protein
MHRDSLIFPMSFLIQKIVHLSLSVQFSISGGGFLVIRMPSLDEAMTSQRLSSAAIPRIDSTAIGGAVIP